MTSHNDPAQDGSESNIITLIQANDATFSNAITLPGRHRSTEPGYTIEQLAAFTELKRRVGKTFLSFAPVDGFGHIIDVEKTAEIIGSFVTSIMEAPQNATHGFRELYLAATLTVGEQAAKPVSEWTNELVKQAFIVKNPGKTQELIKNDFVKVAKAFHNSSSTSAIATNIQQNDSKQLFINYMAEATAGYIKLYSEKLNIEGIAFECAKASNSSITDDDFKNFKDCITVMANDKYRQYYFDLYGQLDSNINQLHNNLSRSALSNRPNKKFIDKAVNVRAIIAAAKELMAPQKTSENGKLKAPSTALVFRKEEDEITLLDFMTAFCRLLLKRDVTTEESRALGKFAVESRTASRNPSPAHQAL